MQTIDLQTCIRTKERGDAVFVDSFDDQQVWLNIQVRGGSASAILSIDEAKQMIEALTRVVEAA